MESRPGAGRHCLKLCLGQDTPLLPEEGWPRHQEDIAKPPLRSGRRAEPAQARAKRERDSAKHQVIGRSHQEKTSLTSHISECVLNTACERPPRLRRFGGFATFFL